MQICEQMKKLREILNEKNIAWHDMSDEMSETVKIARTHFEYKGHKVSVINGFGTYGGQNGANKGFEEKDNMGLLEIMVNGYDPCGWLTAEEVIKYLEDKLG